MNTGTVKPGSYIHQSEDVLLLILITCYTIHKTCCDIVTYVAEYKQSWLRSACASNKLIYYGMYKPVFKCDTHPHTIYVM
jgi:hypothetical protein